MIDPGKVLLAASIAAGFAAAPDAAYSQAKAKPEAEAPHWADSPPRKAAPEQRKAVPRKAAKEVDEGAERKKAEEIEKQRLAALEKEKEETRRRQEMEARCVIKPVMTDADIENCRVRSR